MSRNGEPLRLWIGDFRSRRAKPPTSPDIVLCRLQTVQEGEEAFARVTLGPGLPCGEDILASLQGFAALATGLLDCR